MDNSPSERDFDQADQLIHQRQRHYRKARRAGQVLNQLLARTGYLQRQSQADLAGEWQQVIQPRWRTHTRVGRLRHGVLEIEAANSTLVQHLNFQRNQLLLAIQQRLPEKRIRDLRFRVGNFQPQPGSGNDEHQDH